MGGQNVWLAAAADNSVHFFEQKGVGHIVPQEPDDIGARERRELALAIRRAEVAEQGAPFVFSAADQQFAKLVKLARKSRCSGGRERVQPHRWFGQMLGSPDMPVEIESIVRAQRVPGGDGRFDNCW